MRKISIYMIELLFFVMWLGCIHKVNSNNQTIQALKGFRLSPKIDSLFKEYRKSVPDTFAYAIFIDKKTEGSQYIIMFAPFIKKINPYESGAISFFYLKNRLPVFVYTGLEDFVESESPSFRKSHKSLTGNHKGGEFEYWKKYRINIDFSKSWSCVFNKESNGSDFYIIKGFGEPFLNGMLTKPTVRFTMPDSGSKIRVNSKSYLLYHKTTSK